MRLERRLERLERATPSWDEDPQTLEIEFDGDDEGSIVDYHEARSGDWVVRWPVYEDGEPF